MSDVALNNAVAVVVVFLMAVLGTGLAVADFRRVVTAPRAVLLGTAGQYASLPLVGALAAMLTRPGPLVTEALVLVAASPGGVLSNVFAALGRANVALSLTLTAVSTLLAVLVVPLLVAGGVGLLMGETVTLHLPVVPVVGQLLGLLVLPVLAGMALRHRAPGFVARHAVTARRVAAAGVLLVLGAVVVAQRAVLMTVAADGAAAALAFTTLAVAAGTAVGRVGRLPREDRFVLVAEFGVRNTALAMLLATQVLGRGDLLAAVVLFFVVQTLVLLAVTAAYGSVGRAASASTT